MRRAIAAATGLMTAAPVWASEGSATHLFIPDAVWLPVNLAAFLFLLYWLVGRPMARFLESRREGIAQELHEAQRKLAEAEELRDQVVRRLAEVEREVAELNERAEREGRAEAERIAEQAEAEAARFLRRVDEEVTRRQAEARTMLAQETAALIAELARGILGREVQDADRARVLERSLKAMRSLAGRT